MKPYRNLKFAGKGARTATSLTLIGLAAAPAWAQTVPDAGRTLQEQAPVLEAPKPSQGVDIELPKSLADEPGGAQVTVQSLSISGNSVFSEAHLLGVLGEVTGKTYDLAGLRNLANRISDHYRQAGYPFARAYLPAQSLEDGALRIDVVEGRYGEVKAKGDSELAPKAQAFLAPLKPGDVIESSALERTTLILDDQPGIKTTPIVRPGQEIGTGDLDVRVERTARYSGEVGLDNFGNRYTGQGRAHLNLEANSPFLLGDQATLRSLVTQEGMWFGTLGYSLPIGASGLRAQASYSHVYYEVGKEFDNLDANGTADVTSVGLSYPIVRSQRANLLLSGNWLHKELEDKQGATNSSSNKSSDSVPVVLSFDLRDGLGGGGITYGALTWTTGHLELDSTLGTADRGTANTQGNFTKLNLDLARIQILSRALSLYGHLSGQWSDVNLDSSERFGLGGPYGVRAYPVGEGYGDQGWLAQLELRYAIGAFSPFVFYDAGHVKVNTHPWAGGDNDRSISGPGFGVRYQLGKLALDGTLAWRTAGGAPQSDTKDNRPQIWVSAAYKF
ncbi:MAG: ShlB/FhaC/HecB family hemolysin secretion/activation protein [Betaproteobacteria bacterium]